MTSSKFKGSKISKTSLIYIYIYIYTSTNYIFINYLQENHQVIWSTYNIQHFTNTITNYTRHHHPNHFMHLSSHTKLLSAIFFPRAIVKWNNLSFSVIKSVKILIFIGQLNSTCVQFFWGIIHLQNASACRLRSSNK